MNRDDSELDLFAFRYASGELDAFEAAEFEERLAGDQSAREALARAVEIGQALVSLAAEARTEQWAQASSRRPMAVQLARTERAAIAPPSGTARGRRWAALLLSLTACVAIAVGGFLVMNHRPQRAPLGTAGVSDDLALVWSEHVGQEDEAATDEITAPPLSADLAWNEGTPGASERENSTSLLAADGDPVPSWMLAALSGDEGTDSSSRFRSREGELE